MAGGYTKGEQTAAGIFDAIADYSEWKVGVVTKTTSSTTAVVTHGLSGAPDFVLSQIMGDGGSTPLNNPALTINTTSVTFGCCVGNATGSVTLGIATLGQKASGSCGSSLR